MIDDNRFVILMITLPAGGDAGETIAGTLVERRLAACVNRIPRIHSIYRWEKKVHRDDEELLLIKTARANLDEVERAISAVHPYDVPEMITLPVEGGAAPYFEWLAANTGADSDG